MSADQRRRRAAQNQALFREVNDRIREVLDDFGADGPYEVLCECGRPDCLALVRISRAAYRDVRACPGGFILVPGHETPAAERIRERGDKWLVVEPLA